ncbi:MAG: amidohydrolase [Rhodothermales bacterium]|nr:amidohydrolase [Rhodothermales bacterium]
MMRRLIPLLLLGLAACAQQAPEPTPTLFHSGVIYTVDEDQPQVSAMLVQDGVITAVGETEELRAQVDDADEVDLGGAVVIPGLVDSHAHVRNLSTMRLSADLVGTQSVQEIIARLQAHSERVPDDAWLLGRGWDQNDWAVTDFPTRLDLDDAFPDRPVWLERIDGHAMWANTAAMRAAGFETIAESEDPPGGVILRDASGAPTGVFIDNAEHLVGEYQPSFSEEDLERGLEAALSEMARFGITSVHEAGADMAFLERVKRFIDEDRFTARLYAMTEPGPSFEHYCNNHLIDYGDRLTVRSVKMYLDGALGSRGAALLEDYADDPGNRGLLRTTPADYAVLVQQALDCGYQINSHAIGDAGNRLLLDTYEQAGISPDQRHRNEHAQVVAPGDIERHAQLGVIASMQPTHATSDMYWAEDRVGPGRIRGAYAWRTMLDSGVRLALGSDFPVEQVDPLLGYYAAVTRQDAASWPEGGWYPGEALSREEALRGFTIDGAYAAFQEDKLGSLSPGKWADFVVLSADIMRLPGPDILDAEVQATYVGGEAVYQR